MTEDQENDWAYHGEKLIRLLVRRRSLPGDLKHETELTIKIIAIENLVLSYRLVKALGA